MFKKLFTILVFLILFFLNRLEVEASSLSQVLIINQIRGEESCCQQGTTKLIQEIIKNEDLNNLPISWALRYDSLKSEGIINELEKIKGEKGLLLEITPKLASASGVFYKGKTTGEDWYFAKNAFLIGYTVSERKRLIDNVFNEFKEIYGSFPSFTVSWMIDGWSLNYIQEAYGVKLHELTKEQFETDSYTLYGGIFNLPYYPSKNHPLIPGGSDNRLDMLIVRQTISDPIKNYGSPKAYYTSQPNDYLENPIRENNSYFQNLLTDALFPSFGNGFALLGLENSIKMEKYIDEYLKQLKFLSSLVKDKKINIYDPSDFYNSYKISNPQNSAKIITKDFSSDKKLGVLWYFGKDFRARLLLKDDLLILDDLRNYRGELDEPYFNSPAKTDYAYWVVPYLFDGSEQFEISKNQQSILKKTDLLNGSVTPDWISDPFGIVIKNTSFKTSFEDDILKIIFNDNQNQFIEFKEDSINISRDLNPYFNKPEILLDKLFSESSETKLEFKKHPLFYIFPNQNILEIGWEIDSQKIPLFQAVKTNGVIEIKPLTINKSIEYLDPIFRPDKSKLPPDPKKSIYYWNNKTAVVSRNPIRLFILPLNYLGRPTSVNNIKVEFEKNDGIQVIYPQDYNFRITPWYIDINSNMANNTKVSVTVDDVKVITDEPINFVADCKKETLVCLNKPSQLFEYLKIILGEYYIKVKAKLLSLLPF